MAELPFRFIAGDPSLDFVNTVDWSADGLVDERLTSYDRMTHWVEEAQLFPREVATTLRSAARRQPRRAAEALAHAHRVRALLQHVLSASDLSPLGQRELREFNTLLGAASSQRRIVVAKAGPAQWGWQEPQRNLESPLWPVISSAADLLTSEEAGAIRVCADPSCGWMFLDRSRNGMRRWCSMQTCGTREKSRRRSVRALK